MELNSDLEVKVFLMYITNYPDIVNPQTNERIPHVPRLDSYEDNRSGRFPLLFVGYTYGGKDLENAIYDRRGIYKKYNDFTQKTRYYHDYMELFKLENKDPSYKIKIILLKKSTSRDLEGVLKEFIIKYRMIYGDKCLVGDYHSYFIDKKEKPIEEVLSSAERRRISRRKYEDSIREELREKSKLYYAENKERLREKRIAKAAALNKGIRG
jgi:hypothetical protein